jgi:hypothetical protein
MPLNRVETDVKKGFGFIATCLDGFKGGDVRKPCNQKVLGCLLILIFVLLFIFCFRVANYFEMLQIPVL